MDKTGATAMNRQHRSTSHRSTSQRLGSILFLLSLFLPALAVPARAGADGWTPFGPGGGSVSSLAVDPGDPSRIYAVEGGALYRSLDASATWTRLGGVGDGLQVVVLDPASPSTLFTAGGRLLRSTDGGARRLRLRGRRGSPAAEPRRRRDLGAGFLAGRGWDRGGPGRREGSGHDLLPACSRAASSLERKDTGGRGSWLIRESTRAWQRC
jgi:hypothetical protein